MSRDAQEPEEGTTTGTEPSGEISHLIIGRILGARGVHGELKVQILTDFPKRFASLKTVLIGDRLSQHEVESVRFHQDLVLLKLRDVNGAEEAERLRGGLIRILVEEAVPLAEDQYYWHQIIGLNVWTTAGEFLGKVVEILETGANDVYVVRADSREVLVPAIADVVKQIDLQDGKMVIEPLPGMMD